MGHIGLFYVPTWSEASVHAAAGRMISGIVVAAGCLSFLGHGYSQETGQIAAPTPNNDIEAVTQQIAYVINGSFEEWDGNLPRGWRLVSGSVDLATDASQGRTALRLNPSGADVSGTRVQLAIENGPGVTGTYIQVSMDVKVNSRDRLGFALYGRQHGQIEIISVDSSGKPAWIDASKLEADWQTLTANARLDPNIDIGTLTLEIMLYAGSQNAAFVDNVSLILEGSRHERTAYADSKPPQDWEIVARLLGYEQLGRAESRIRINDAKLGSFELKETREVIHRVHERSFAVSIVPPQNAVLDCAFRISPLIRNFARGTAKFEVLLSIGRGAVQSLYHSEIDLSSPSPEDFLWQSFSIDISNTAGRKATLTFAKTFVARAGDTVKPLYDFSPADFLMWSRPIVRPRSLPGKKNIILVSFDTLSAGHLGFMGYHRDTSPNMDKLARQGVYFKTVVSQAPWTTPSHFALLTSTYPRINGMDQPIHELNRRANPAVPTMAELLRDKGYLCGAFTGSGSISAPFGFYRGFDFYSESTHEDADLTFDRAAEWLVEHKDRTFFLFLHTYEPHDGYTGRYFVDNEDITPVIDDGSESPEIIHYRTALYDGDIRNADEAFGEFLQFLDDQGLSENTSLVVTSDHGEDMGGRVPPGPAPSLRYSHGFDLDDSQLLVPLIIRDRDIQPRTEGIPYQVRSVDILPTVMDYLGVGRFDSFQGVSLRGMIQGRDRTDRPAFSEATTAGTERISLRKDDYKYIHRVGYGSLGKWWAPGMPLTPLHELYFLPTDPREMRNLAQEREADVKRMNTALNDLVREIESYEYMKAVDSRLTTVNIEDDRGLVEQLKALGYLE